MINNYKGNYPYNEINILTLAPQSQGVYYCGWQNSNNQLFPLYVGRAMGIGVTINNRLLDHKRNENWPDVTHFGYILCSTDQEAITLEKNEILRCQPKYNNVGK